MSREELYLAYLSKSEENLHAALSRLGIEKPDSFLEIEHQFYLIEKSKIGEIEKRVFDLPATFSNAVSSAVLNQVVNIAKPSGIEVFVKNLEKGQFALLFKKEKTLVGIEKHAQGLKILKKVAEANGLIPLFLEKPFANMPASDMILKWSFSHNHFDQIIETAMRHAIQEHHDFIYEIATCSCSDTRLFAHELLKLPLYFTHESKELTPGTFCKKVGDTYIFQGFGSSSIPAINICIIEAAFVDSLTLIIDEIQTRDLKEVLQKHLQESHFNKERGDTSKHLFASFLAPKTIRATSSIINEEELAVLQKMCFIGYVEKNQATISNMVRYFKLHILPELKCDFETKVTIEQEIASLERIEKMALELGPEIQAKMHSEIAIPRMQNLKLLVKNLIKT